MPFTVIVSDNFHDMDAGERYNLGPFETVEDAIAASKEIVDGCLASAYRPGITPARLYESYVSVGETPRVLSSGAEGMSFSALDYAKQRCEVLCATGKASRELGPMPPSNAFDRTVSAIIAWLTDGVQLSKTAVGPQDTMRLSCCKEASWVSGLDLDQAGGFEFMLGKCDRCGAHWMHVYCTAASAGGYEPVSPSDVERMRALAPGPERRAFMRHWVENNT